MWPFTSKKERIRSSRCGRSTFRPRLETLEDRYLLSAGALDPTFGSGGTVTTSFAQGVQNSAQALVPGPAKR